MKFPDVSRLGSVTVPDAGHFIVLLVREDLTPGKATGVLRGKIARAKHPLDAYDAGIEDVVDAARAALAAEPPAPSLDVGTLIRAMELAMAAVDDEWTIWEFADITAAEYARLTAA